MVFRTLMRRCFVLLLCALLLVSGVPSARDTDLAGGLLFEVEKEGVDSSYVFGTIHSEDPRVTRLPAAVQEAFDASPRFVMEVLLDANNLLRSMTALLLTDGRTLKDIVGPRLYLESVEAVTSLGYPAVTVRQFKPWAVVTLLSIPPPVTGRFLDLLLYQQALKQDKEVIGLESVAEQYASFDALSEENQIKLLRHTLKTRHQISVLYRTLLDAYLRRDLATLVKLNDEHGGAGDPGSSAALNKAVIDDRNRRMVQRMLPILQRGGVFVAVGALHLPGKHGVLNLLRDQGYRIRRVY